MLLASKYNGKCIACHEPYGIGEQVSWAHGHTGALHAGCSDEGKVLAAKVNASRAKDSSVDVPSPTGLAFLPFQRAGMAYALARKSTLLADEMGLGKTIQAIGLINAQPSIGQVLIVTTASLKLNWLAEYNRWTTRNLSVGIFPKSAAVTIINYDILHKLDESDHWDLLICDEGHAVKNPK